MIHPLRVPNAPALPCPSKSGTRLYPLTTRLRSLLRAASPCLILFYPLFVCWQRGLPKK